MRFASGARRSPQWTGEGTPGAGSAAGLTVAPARLAPVLPPSAQAAIATVSSACSVRTSPVSPSRTARRPSTIV